MTKKKLFSDTGESKPLIEITSVTANELLKLVLLKSCDDRIQYGAVMAGFELEIEYNHLQVPMTLKKCKVP